ncbi:DNA-binding transcriptional regulator, LysR family [Rhizobiales bacterium GAS188]|nr:DNA-binding transcriptional regulator, LysR family [Rhizobiales bacterium GAS188]
MRFDLVDLRLFLHVAEAASITHGAAKANMALASASERIRGMEELLGVALLERGRRGVRPTPAGRTLLHHARVVTQQIERMRGELSGYAGGLKGYVRLLANTSALSEFLPEVLNGFLATYPNIDIDLEEQPSYDIVRSVADGFADAGIVADIVDFAGLETFPFATDRLVIIMPRRHPLARRRSLPFRELLDHDFVGLGATSALQQHLGQHAVQAGRPLKLRVRLGSFDAVCRMVENGVGVAVIPETAARRSGKAMAIRIARLTDPWSLRRLTVCVRSLEALPIHAQRLVEHLRLQGAKAASAAGAAPARHGFAR